MLIRAIPSKWAKAADSLLKVREGDFSDGQIKYLNSKGYNIYYYPNYPKFYTPGTNVDGTMVDVFEYVFLDMDLKDGVYADKESFLEVVCSSVIEPTRINDSGNGVHVYYRVNDLDAMGFLKLQRRLCRMFNTDQNVSKIGQLMRLPGAFNVKKKDNPVMCETIFEGTKVYSSEELDALLPPITPDDLDYCEAHYNKTFQLAEEIKIDDKIPHKFHKLLSENPEAKAIWKGETDDRSKSDYRIGHLMYGAGFTKQEALSVLVNSQKALSRAPKHRISYASNIVDKIWTFEEAPDKEFVMLSESVKSILSRHGDTLKGTRFPCWNYLDGTNHGFRLGQVIGLVAGSGVGKTAIALNMFKGFVQNNPDYDHFVVPLEQPGNEIAERWKKLCGDQEHLYEKVHILSNYDPDGTFRHLSFDEIKDYLLNFQKVTGRKVGAVVIDHIGALKKKGKDGENQDLMTICHAMKAFAIQTNTLLIMQSQSSREKAGIGDLELDKDAAYGTVYFESYCDFLITLWQPCKRMHSEAKCPTVTAFKFCKIRHKNKEKDIIQEDVCYKMYFDSNTESLRDLTHDENESFKFFLNKAVNKRKQDKKTDLVTYESVRSDDGAVNNDKHQRRDTESHRVH